MVATQQEPINVVNRSNTNSMKHGPLTSAIGINNAVMRCIFASNLQLRKTYFKPIRKLCIYSHITANGKPILNMKKI